MAKFSFLPIFTDTLLADCGNLNDSAFGAYHRILYLLWRSPKCRIPNDEKWIAHKLGRSIEDYRKIFKPLIEEFCKTTGNWIYQKRLSKEYLFVKNKSKKQSDKAKLRWDKEKLKCRGNAPTPTPTPTQESKKEREFPTTKISPLEIGMEFEVFWNAYPKKVGKREAIKQYQTAREEGISHETIINGVRQYLECSNGTEERFIPNPGRWLEEGRWDDKPIDGSQNPIRAANRNTTYGDSLSNAANAVRNKLREEEGLRQKAS